MIKKKFFLHIDPPIYQRFDSIFWKAVNIFRQSAKSFNVKSKSILRSGKLSLVRKVQASKAYALWPDSYQSSKYFEVFVLMGIIIILLLGFSLLLFLVSFFQKDPYKELKEEVDQLTLQHVQELYQMKQRLRILEEELLVSDDHFTSFTKTSNEIHDIIKNQVLALAQQGKQIEQIASQSSLAIDDVYRILKEYSDSGS